MTAQGGTNPSGRGQWRSLRSVHGGGRVSSRGGRGASLTLLRRGDGGGKALEERRNFYSAAERWSKYKEKVRAGV